MAFERVRKLRKRVSEISVLKRGARAAVQKKPARDGYSRQSLNYSVANLIEQAGSDYAKGETDMAIYRLTRVLSEIEKEAAESSGPSLIPLGVSEIQERPFRHLLLRNEEDFVGYSGPWYEHPCKQPCEEPVPMTDADYSQGTIASCDVGVQDDLNYTIRDADSQVFEFSDMVERSFNLLTISGGILEDEATRLDEDAPNSTSADPEAPWKEDGYHHGL
ncbi:KLTH0F07238p [Lachancea thermotolerans CBS 6340]|uniref:KLTH0F07238p n=1 Tax=Lachancea thermotolerans (strain ATCC 56472 / CBS 6340 / NRRL Y-8284) TaxID=559295 RepID=C5DKT0_LACTC|nr:KLTH0F07238p [Lachancea thermotolerans CBS 6340]CAR24081.1 KLTH0F07238p [Lachancea thermotolerans CBS 6340]